MDHQRLRPLRGERHITVYFEIVGRDALTPRELLLLVLFRETRVFENWNLNNWCKVVLPTVFHSCDDSGDEAELLEFSLSIAFAHFICKILKNRDVINGRLFLLERLCLQKI